ncbi:unnamed protein product [Brachionus calyciflorus]|uniref:Uncharacterized protein n=1 Tax=Brachionus calyciflorus TaxID=104777 RepID=A0A814MG66_9BILA|nr:unnamed protein product [Brachionus calyciflorus]
MNTKILTFLLIFVFRPLSNAQRFLSGSSKQEILLWNNSQDIKTYNPVEIVYSIDHLNGIFVSATHDNLIKTWNIFSQTKFKESNEKQNELRSVLLLNQSICLAGYENYLYFWSYPDLTKVKHIHNTSLNKIKVLKLLKEDKLVLIGSSNGYIHVFSLLSETIIDSYNSGGNKNTLDVLNRKSLVSDCESNKAICSFYFDSSNKIIKNKTVCFSTELYAAKIINSSFAIFGVNEVNLVTWDMKSTSVNKIESKNAKVYCIEIFDKDTFITGGESGKIIFWNLKNLSIIKEITKTDIFYVLKNIDFDFNALVMNSESSKFLSNHSRFVRFLQ